MGVGLRELDCSGVGDSELSGQPLKARARELLSPGVTSNESVSTLEPTPVAGATRAGQALGSRKPPAQGV